MAICSTCAKSRKWKCKIDRPITWHDMCKFCSKMKACYAEVDFDKPANILQFPMKDED